MTNTLLLTMVLLLIMIVLLLSALNNKLQFLSTQFFLANREKIEDALEEEKG